jgi:hypothetical protein
MTYDPRTQRITIPTADLDRAWSYLRFAIRHIRMAAGKPLEGGPEQPQAIDDHEYAEIGILDAARAIGLDLGPGSDRPGRLDVRDVN